MSTWLRYVLIVFGLGVALAVGIGFFLPKTWDVSESLVIHAPASQIDPWVSELERWPEWAPWASHRDATMKFTFGKTHAGKGATFAWTGKRSGSGRLLVTRADPAKGLWYVLRLKNANYTDHGSITYTPADGGTRVTWHDAGSVGGNFIGRYFVATLEHSLAQQFDLGLAQLKQMVESGRTLPKVDPPGQSGVWPKPKPKKKAGAGGAGATPAVAKAAPAKAAPAKAAPAKAAPAKAAPAKAAPAHP